MLHLALTLCVPAGDFRMPPGALWVLPVLLEAFTPSDTPHQARCDPMKLMAGFELCFHASTVAFLLRQLVEMLDTCAILFCYVVQVSARAVNTGKGREAKKTCSVAPLTGSAFSYAEA